MAEMIPEYAVHASDAVETLYQNLSQMLGSGYKVVQYLESCQTSISPSKKPINYSLFWIQKSQQSLFVYVSHSNTSDISIDKNKTDGLAANISKNTEIRNILKFQQRLLPANLLPHKAKLVPFLAFFPNVDDHKIKLGIKTHGLFLAGKQSMQGVELLNLLRTCMGIISTPFVIKQLQTVFSPEIIIKSAPSNGKKNKVLLDENQEIAVKSEISLPVSARRSNNYNLRVINGVAGSGKTQVLMHRASLIRKLFPLQKVLILCHNPAIKQSIESQYEQLHPGDRNIKISAFMDWCRKRMMITQTLVYDIEITDLIEEIYQRELAHSGVSKNMFMSEISFIKGHLIFTEANYLALKNTNLSDGVQAETNTNQPTKDIPYHDIWRATICLNNELAASNRVLWNDIPGQLLQSTEAGKLLEHYDHILVDEAQYFAPLYYELIKKSLKQHSGQLYLAYDENQGFLKSRLHLQDTGLDLRGHSIRLLFSYRLNPAIMHAAHAFHLNQLPKQSDDIFSNSGHGKNEDIKPRLLHFPSEQDEQTRLLKEIHNLINSGQKVKDILILTTDPVKAHPLASSIRSMLKLKVDLPTMAHHNPDALQVCPLDSATGLESPIVFICGIQDLFEKTENSQPSTDASALLMENTRKLYMGMTRASKQLILMMTAENIPQSLITPYIDIPTIPDEKVRNQAEPIRYLHG